jgi:hypothetical protein
VLADDDVARLDVAVQHPPAVRVLDRVTHVQESPQELAQLQRAVAMAFLQPLVGVELLDGFLERVTTDEPHRIEGPAVGVGAQAVDRDDPRVLQPAGDLGLEEEPLAADGVVGVLVEDLFEGDLTFQLGVQRHEDGAQPAPGVGSEDAEPLAVAGGRSDGVAGRAIGAVVLGRGRDDMGQGAAEVGVADPGQALAGRATRRDRGETPLHFASVLLDVAGHEGVDRQSVVGIEVAAVDEVVGQVADLVQGPGLEGGHELDLVDQPVLEGERAKQEVAVGGDGGHGSGLPGGRHGRWACGPRRRGPAAETCAGSVGLSHARAAHAAPLRPIGPPARSTARSIRLRAGAPFLAESGIGGSLAAPPLPHHRAYGSVHGGSIEFSVRRCDSPVAGL